VLRTHLRPHDRVVVDDPTYPGLIDVLGAVGTAPTASPSTRTTDGDPLTCWPRMRLAARGSESTSSTTTTRPASDLPTRSGPTSRRSANGHDAMLVVDETSVQLADAADTDARPLPMAAHLPSAISIGSLSKTHWSGLRIAWVRADRRTMRRLADAHATYTQGTPLLDQLVAVELLHDTEPHLIALRQRLSGQRQALVAALATALPAWKPNRPAGGVSLWVTLPTTSPHARSCNALLRPAFAWLPAAPSARSSSTTRACACRTSCPPQTSKGPWADRPPRRLGPGCAQPPAADQHRRRARAPLSRAADARCLIPPAGAS
jgi:DNA-binding transcriptional MocR family regulator